jgi:hypothetical protein
MSYHPQFVPEQCSSSEQRAITVGVRLSPIFTHVLIHNVGQAGVTFEQVYAFADDNDSMFIGGYAQTIGASGGWMMVWTGPCPKS